MRVFRRSIVMMVLMAAGACALSAAEPIDAGQMPAAWAYDEHFDSATQPMDEWWNTFDDATLDSIVNLGLSYNYNLALAERRIQMARASLEMARAAYYPTIGVSASWTRARNSGANTAVTTPAVTLDYFGAAATMSWEIDVFGRIAKQVEAGKATVEISRAERAAVEVSIAAEIATSYITLRTYQAQLAVARSHIAKQQHVLAMTEARHEAGLASMLDVSQAKVVLYSTQASIPGLEAAIQCTLNGIAVLVGEFPQATQSALVNPKPLPDERQIVGVGVPADLLRRRPDVIEAEQTLARDAASLGLAKKDYLPSLTLDGSIGTSAHKMGDLFTDRSFTYSVAPKLSWTLFSGNSRRYAIASAKEQVLADIDSYNLTLQNAVQEVDNAIATYGGTLANIDMLTSTVEQSDKSLELSLDLYRNSLSSFTNVVDAQMNLLTYQNNLVAAQGNALKQLIALYKALGGGWR